jgi:hypothetical protein
MEEVLVFSFCGWTYVDVARLWKNKTEKIPQGLDRKFGKKLLTAPYALRSIFMKFTKYTGHVGLSLLYCLLMTGCQVKDDYYLMQEYLKGEDAYCDEAKDLNSCEERADRCQPAFKESEDVDAEPVFDICISNHHDDLPGYTGGSDDGTTAGTDGGTTGSTTGGTDGTTTGGTTGGTTGSTTGSTTGGTDGGTTGSTDGGTTGVTGGTTGSSAPVDPTVEEAYSANCSNVPDEDMWIKVTVEEKNGSRKETVQKKVKVCHFTGSGTTTNSHTIVIACPALRPHVDHHDDYIGACRL